MKIRFWGVRGSVPSPITPAQVRSRISAVIQRIREEDILSPTAREKFLSTLPEWLFGTVGGNTPCVELISDNGSRFIFDAGTGIRQLGVSESSSVKKSQIWHLFFSHLHWDHIQGLPFFSPAFNSDNEINFYSPREDLESILRNQMNSPYFPVNLDVMGAKKNFHNLIKPLLIDGVSIQWRAMNHPGGCFSYRLEENGNRFIYSTDTELSTDDFIKNEENTNFFQSADVLILDSQYTLGEAIEKFNWGHSAFSMAVDFASNWEIKNLVLFHHEPTYDDKKLYGILQSAKWYVEHMSVKGLNVFLAKEGMEIVL